MVKKETKKIEASNYQKLNKEEKQRVLKAMRQLGYKMKVKFNVKFFDERQ